MQSQAYTIYCCNCGVEITWAPIVKQALDSPKVLHYCCQDCLDGFACCCGERMEMEEQRAGSSTIISSW